MRVALINIWTKRESVIWSLRPNYILPWSRIWLSPTSGAAEKKEARSGAEAARQWSLGSLITASFKGDRESRDPRGSLGCRHLPLRTVWREHLYTYIRVHSRRNRYSPYIRAHVCGYICKQWIDEVRSTSDSLPDGTMNKHSVTYMRRWTNGKHSYKVTLYICQRENRDEDVYTRYNERLCLVKKKKQKMVARGLLYSQPNW